LRFACAIGLSFKMTVSSASVKGSLRVDAFPSSTAFFVMVSIS